MASGKQPRSELGRYLAKTLVEAGVYFGTAKLGLQLASRAPQHHGGVAADWDRARGARSIWGYRLWPGVALGAALANTFTGDAPAVTVLGITIGNTLEALVGAYLLRAGRFRPSLDRVRDVLALVVLAAGLSTMVSATLGVTSLWIGDQIDRRGDLPSAWRVWWLGDMGGDLLVAPLLLVLASGARLTSRPGALAEACMLLAALVGLSLLDVLAGLAAHLLDLPAADLGGAPVPPARGDALEPDRRDDRGDLRGAGHGTVCARLADDSLLLSQTFTGVAGATALLLAAITSEREQAVARAPAGARPARGEGGGAHGARWSTRQRELELQGLIARNMAEGVCLVRAADS